MTLAQRLVEWGENRREVAIDIAIRAGVLTRCATHKNLAYDGRDLRPAYKLANDLISRCDAAVAVFDGERRELEDQIKSLAEEFRGPCGICAKVSAVPAPDSPLRPSA